MTKSSQKKGQNYIPFLQSTYPAMQRKTSSGGQGAPAARQSSACVPGPRWAGGSCCTSERPRDPGPRWAGGTQASCQTSARDPSPQWAGGAPAARQSGARAPGPQLAGGAPATRQSGACVPGPRRAGELRPRARPARTTLAPGGQGGSSRVLERRTDPRPPDTLLGIYIP